MNDLSIRRWLIDNRTITKHATFTSHFIKILVWGLLLIDTIFKIFFHHKYKNQYMSHLSHLTLLPLNFNIVRTNLTYFLYLHISCLALYTARCLSTNSRKPFSLPFRSNMCLSLMKEVLHNIMRLIIIIKYKEDSCLT